MRNRAMWIGLVLVCAGIAAAAEPPSLINYQGVLRNSADKPLSGPYNMTFRLFTLDAGGDEILVDSHTLSSGGQVNVSGGMFNVLLGGGVVSDGGGPGTYLSLKDLFRDYGTVFLQVEVGGEVLLPRTRIVSSAYAVNADALDGRHASSFVDTSSTAQSKAGQLQVDVTGQFVPYGLEVLGGPSHFQRGTEHAYLAYSARGVEARGSEMGGYFADADGGAHSEVGCAGMGIRGYGTFTGGYFSDTDDGSQAYVAYGGYGIDAQGTAYGGRFHNGASYTGNAVIADLNRGVTASGSEAGGLFQDSDSASYAYVGYGASGISAWGTSYGGFFSDYSDSGYGMIGYGDIGLEAFGNTAGAIFGDRNGTGQAILAGDAYGVDGRGPAGGGTFRDTDNSATTYVAYGNFGVDASGSTVGGYFHNSGGYTGAGYAGYYNYGVYGYGSYTGAYVYDTDSSGLARVGYDIYKIQGTGTVSFVQNHPYDPGLVVVYAAPEGDEVATYTRGTARLERGGAKVGLGTTFAWVTNPDVGLTAHLTPRGDCRGLYVASLTTGELVVRELDGGTSDVVFDYIVYGLRIGFEEASIVQPKQEEAFIPSMANHRAAQALRPELRSQTALARFSAMTTAVGGGAPDLSRAATLRAAVQEYDPAVHGPVTALHPELVDPGTRAASPEIVAATPSAQPQSADVVAQRRDGSSGAPPSVDPGLAPIDDEGNVYAKSFRPRATDLASSTAVSEAVEPGDVLVIDPERPGVMRLARAAADRGVFGVVAADPGLILGSDRPRRVSSEGAGTEPGVASKEASVGSGSASAQIPVAVTGIVQCKADAGFGSIRAGDLLTTSPSPGRAMRAADPALGTILGKALEPLEAGTGVIRVLVMLR